jgi:hypothetical protein
MRWSGAPRRSATKPASGASSNDWSAKSAVKSGVGVGNREIEIRKSLARLGDRLGIDVDAHVGPIGTEHGRITSVTDTDL